MALDIGRVAYMEYCKTFEKQDCDCDLEKWEEIGQLSQNAWRAAACAVLKYIDLVKDLDPDVCG